MQTLHQFPITKKWPPQHPERIQLYSLNTPNGVKASIMLEEIELPYEPHLVDFGKKDQLSPEFTSLNPYQKIPALIDPHGPDDAPLALFESGAILMYLADKTGKLLPNVSNARYEVLKWLTFQIAGIGPMFGQVGFFHKFDGKNFEDKRPRDHYVTQSRKLLGVLNAQLAERIWLTGDAFTIADIATFPLVRNLIGFYGAADLVGFGDFPFVARSLEAFLSRPAVRRGLTIPSLPE